LSFSFWGASDGVVAASATNEVGFSGSGGFPLGIGLYGDVFFYGAARPEEEMVELIRYAVEQLGVTLLDTSHAYGPFTNEVLIGKVNNTCKTSSSANNYSSKSISSSDQHVVLHSKIG
jgi:hypothetical protein